MTDTDLRAVIALLEIDLAAVEVKLAKSRALVEAYREFLDSADFDDWSVTNNPEFDSARTRVAELEGK